MTKVQDIKARLASGVLKDFRVEVSEGEPWQLEYQGLDGTLHCLRARDLFEALVVMRQELERDGCQVLVAGARPDVTPSGMSRSMGGGRKAYVVDLGSPASGAEMVDIFEYAGPEVVGTVQQQRDYFQAWTRSLKQRAR